MSSRNSSALAYKEAGVLTQCGISIYKEPLKAGDLQGLRDIMIDGPSPSKECSGLGLPMVKVREALFPLAKEHVDPVRLSGLYLALRGDLNMSNNASQQMAIELAMAHAEPQQLTDAYVALDHELYLPTSTAQAASVVLAKAGSDAKVLLSTYKAEKRKGSSDTVALQLSTIAAVNAQLSSHGGGRYAKDAMLYNSTEFQKHYQDAWMDEWIDAPMEKRVVNYIPGQEGFQAYRASELSDFFGTDGPKLWTAAKAATQQRIASDGKTYTIEEFKQYFGANSWQAQWDFAPEVACKECAQPVHTAFEVLV